MNTKADPSVRDAKIETLLRTAYSLTHRMHEGHPDLHAQSPFARKAARDYDANLRAQRDLIDAEIARRCER